VAIRVLISHIEEWYGNLLGILLTGSEPSDTFPHLVYSDAKFGLTVSKAKPLSNSPLAQFDGRIEHDEPRIQSPEEFFILLHNVTAQRVPRKDMQTLGSYGITTTVLARISLFVVIQSA
jgi:hypothetical protein